MPYRPLHHVRFKKLSDALYNCAAAMSRLELAKRGCPHCKQKAREEYLEAAHKLDDVVALYLPFTELDRVALEKSKKQLERKRAQYAAKNPQGVSRG